MTILTPAHFWPNQPCVRVTDTRSFNGMRNCLMPPLKAPMTTSFSWYSKQRCVPSSRSNPSPCPKPAHTLSNANGTVFMTYTPNGRIGSLPPQQLVRREDALLCQSDKKRTRPPPVPCSGIRQNSDGQPGIL